MRLSVGGALLCVILCAVATGCATGVYGAAVTAQNPNVATGPAPQAVAGAYPFGGLLWYPAFNSTLTLIKSPRRFGRRTLLAAPSAPAAGIGAKTIVVGHPTPGATYRVAVRVRGSTDLAGDPLRIQLQALLPDGSPTKVNAASQRLRPGWRWYSLSGTLPKGRRIGLRAVVSVSESVGPTSRLAVGGIRERRISAGPS